MRNPDDKCDGSNDWPITSVGISIVVGGIIGALNDGFEAAGQGAIIGTIIGGLFLGYVPLIVWRRLRGPW